MGVVGFMGLSVMVIVDEALLVVFGEGRWGWPWGRRGRIGWGVC